MAFFLKTKSFTLSGRISSAHGVHCDNEPEGVRCKQAIALAIEHSKAVDFVKTGIPEDFRSELRVG